MSAPTPFPDSPYPAPAPPNIRPYAGWWSRVGASMLDGLIAFGFLLVPGVIAFFVLLVAIDDEDQAESIFDIVFIPLALLFWLLYYPLTMKRAGAHNGQTWGKQALGIRVIRTDGAPVDVGTAIVREALVKYLLFGSLAACLLYIPTLLNYLWPLWDENNEALHDKIANTQVVSAAWLPPPPRQTWMPPVPPEQPWGR